MGTLKKMLAWGRREANDARMNVRMPSKVKDRLIAAQVNSGCKDLTEYLRLCFTVTEWLWEMTRDGDKFFRIDTAGKKTPVLMPWEEGFLHD